MHDGSARRDVSATLSLDEYAALSVEVALEPERTQALLLARGLDEATWDAASAVWDARLSQALDEEQPDGSPAPFAIEYAEAIARAQQRHVTTPLSLDVFCALLAALRAGRLPQVLHQQALSMGQFMATQNHWMQHARHDPVLRERLMGSHKAVDPKPR